MNHNRPPNPSTDKDHLSERELQSYLDNELSPAARERATRHLAACRQCQMELNQLQILFTLLEGIPEFPLKTNLSRRILNQIEAKRERTPALPWIAALQTALAATLLTLTIPTLLKSPLATTLLGAWNQIVLFFQRTFLEEAGAWDANLRALRDQIATFLRTGIHLPIPELHFAPLWSLFLFAAFIGILGNALLLGTKAQVSNGNHT